MSDRDAYFEKIWQSKAEHRKKLQELPFLDKMVIVARMKERAIAIKSAKRIER